MQIAVLSGKGGTGKTTVAVNLFNMMNQSVLIDTDTEEPNSHIFLDGELIQNHTVYKGYPVVDYDKCGFCGKCGELCNFNAIIPTKSKVIVFDDLCHDCGLCKLACPNDAITYKEKPLGVISEFSYQGKEFFSGKLNIGEVSGVRLIEELKEYTSDRETLVIDCPPGVACSTVTSLNGVDYAVIVIEPTPFGLSDMKMVVELLRTENIPFGVVINKADLGDLGVKHYLQDEHIPLISEIPFDEEFAKIYSEGKLISDHSLVFREKIEDIIAYLKEVVK
jgi:MinD superfamily P-loop ATPase